MRKNARAKQRETQQQEIKMKMKIGEERAVKLVDCLFTWLLEGALQLQSERADQRLKSTIK